MVIVLAGVMGWKKTSRESSFPKDRQKVIFCEQHAYQGYGIFVYKFSADAERWESRVWNPLDSMLDALELEGAVPEEKRGWYVSLLGAHLINDRDPGFEDIWWALRRATARQIATAVWQILCQEKVNG